MKLTVKANAKLNLTLDVVGKKDDGYHLLETVMQSVSLHDTITLKDDRSESITVTTSNPDIADDESNLAYRAAKAFFEATGIKNPGVEIRIKKRIPTEAGLAGGSADAAGVLVGLNELFSAGLEVDALCDIGERLGADVPFCIVGGTVLASGIGNILSPIPTLEDCFFVVAKPESSVSTANAYALVDSYKGELLHPNSISLSEHICGGDIKAVARGCVNVFEQALELKESTAIKELMLEEGALGACLTGSGSAVFGIFSERDEADDCAEKLERVYDDVFVVEPVSFGCEIDE